MLQKFILTGLFLALYPHASSYAQAIPSGVAGWYNGDWQPAIPGINNFYVSPQQFGRTYDDFVVPDGGWTVIGVFSHNSMSTTGVTQASWEIRSNVSAGNAGTLVASGLSPAKQTLGPAVGGGSYVYLIEVDNLWVQLAPGKYWLSVTPVVSGNSYLCATLAVNAIGNSLGNDGEAFLSSTTGSNFSPVQQTGQGGTSGDFSLGVMITAPWVGREPAWQYDVVSLALQMESVHSLPYPGISLEDFDSAMADLSSQIPTLSDPQIRTGVQALVASIGDPHTDVEWPSPSPFQFLPLSFYWFDDGIYVTNAPAQYQNLLGGMLVSVNQTDTSDVISALAPLVAHDNDSWLKSILMANKLTNTDYLYGTGVTDSIDDAQIQVQTASGNLVSADVQAMPQNQFPKMIPVFQGSLPLYRQRANQYYWSTVIDGGATVYFQYNSCTEDPNLPSATFLAQLNQTLQQSGVERLIVDMRNNSGGLATILDPWITQLKTTRFNAPGRLYVIVGRATFSAAMEATDMFKDGTAAIFVGEPTGGKPRFLLRRGDFGLSYFGLRASFSNGVENANETGPTLMPDIQTGLTFQQYMNGDDPAMDAILNIPAPQ